MAITSDSEMKDALQNGLRHFCPVCRSHELVLERLNATSSLCVEQEAGCTKCLSTWVISYSFGEVLKLDSDDRRMGPEQLREKYDGAQGTNWGQHPDYPMSVWQEEVANKETRVGYWEWVTGRIHAEPADV